MTRHITTFLSTRLRDFREDTSGVALIEFAIALPLFLLVFAVIIEGSLMMMSYQAAIVGVRDATRYLARAVPENICTVGGSVAGYSTEVQTLVSQGLTGSSLFPTSVTVTSVTPSYACFTGSYRNGPVAVAQVTAVLNLSLPFQGLINFAGASMSDFTASVTDQARVAGS